MRRHLLRGHTRGLKPEVLDRYLRGRPGVGQVRVDATGRVTSQQEFSQLAQPGYSVTLKDASIAEYSFPNGPAWQRP